MQGAQSDTEVVQKRPPPAAGSETQEARGGQPRGSTNNPKWVRIINSVMNQSPVIRRKDADRLVNQGRAAWVAPDQVRLDLAHPTNQRAAEQARGWEQNHTPSFDRDRISQELRLYGPHAKGGLVATDRRRTRFEAPPQKAPALNDPRRLVIRDKLTPQRVVRDHHDAVQPNGLPKKWRQFLRPRL